MWHWSLHQLFVQAYDMDVPGEIIQSFVSVDFIRNMAPPTFTQSQVSASSYDYEPRGYVVTDQIRATDSDPLVSMLSKYTPLLDTF